MSDETLHVLLLAATGLLLLALVAIKLSHRLGMPVLLLFVGIGMLLGDGGIGLTYDNVELTRQVGTLLLAIILWEGGYTTRAAAIKPVVARSVVLATAGVLISVAVTSTVVFWVLDVDWRTAVIFGAVASSTDAAATFAILRRLPVVHRIRQTLEAESGFNDPPVIVLIAVVISDAWFEMSPAGMLTSAAFQLGVGAAVGLLVALGGASLLRLAALPASGLYPLGAVAIGMVAFAGAGIIGASGLLACYVAGLVVGNSGLPHHRTTIGFVEALAWLAQMSLFMMLGLLASPHRLVDAIAPALVVGVLLTFVARPVSVFACLLPFRVPLREQIFISWGGLRGAVPIVLAAMTMASSVPDGEHIFDVVFLMVIVFTLVQGPTLPLVARLTRVSEPAGTTEMTFESAALDDADVMVLKAAVLPGSRLHRVTVKELRLPDRATVSMIIRGGEILVPGDDTHLRTGDELILTCKPEDLPAVTERLSHVDRGGRLGRWFSGTH
ncbi:potassium/proton antiporter [Granulicoccus sp. GXG6511]|uniref:potassium/proton antiporter n=1 Tax=Granulicoccus sp. GXG6511 TaxID=3381351 RepID=UPI003D7D420C